MAVNQHVNKVILNGTTLMDVSDNTITDEDMMEGVTATMPDGSVKSGKMRLDDLEDLTDARGGIRYYNGNYQVYDVANETWVDLSIGSSGGDYGSFVKLADVTNTDIYGQYSPYGIFLKWTDPDDVVITGNTGIGTFAEWDGTLVVRKIGSAPNNIDDGVTIINSKVKNAYSNTYYLDTNNVQIGITYYYRFFPYSKSGIITNGSVITYTPSIPSFATSRDEEIIEAVGLSDSGDLCLYTDCGWRIGDERYDPDTVWSDTSEENKKWVIVAGHGSHTSYLSDSSLNASGIRLANNRLKKNKSATNIPTFVLSTKGAIVGGAGSDYNYLYDSPGPYQGESGYDTNDADSYYRKKSVINKLSPLIRTIKKSFIRYYGSMEWNYVSTTGSASTLPTDTQKATAASEAQQNVTTSISCLSYWEITGCLMHDGPYKYQSSSSNNSYVDVKIPKLTRFPYYQTDANCTVFGNDTKHWHDLNDGSYHPASTYTYKAAIDRSTFKAQTGNSSSGWRIAPIIVI